MSFCVPISLPWLMLRWDNFGIFLALQLNHILGLSSFLHACCTANVCYVNLPYLIVIYQTTVTQLFDRLEALGKNPAG